METIQKQTVCIKYSLSIVDFRGEPCHMFSDDDLTFEQIISTIGDFFIGWEYAFKEQSHQQKSIQELEMSEELGYTSFYLKSVTTTTKHKVILSPNNDFKKGDFRVVINSYQTSNTSIPYIKKYRLGKLDFPTLTLDEVRFIAKKLNLPKQHVSRATTLDNDLVDYAVMREVAVLRKKVAQYPYFSTKKTTK